jgi:site-specific recombinase XerD
MPIVRPYQRGKSWYIDYTLNGKRERKKIANDRKTATVIAAQIQNNLDKGQYGIPPDLTEISIGNLATEFLNTKRNRVAEATLKRYGQYFDYFTNFIESNFPSNSHVHQIREVYVEECIQSIREKGGSPKTANETLSIIKAMFDYAIKHYYASLNPAKDIPKFPDAPATAVEYFSDDEMTQILEDSPERWRDIFEFFYLTGLRNAELINLTWSDVDSENNQIKIRSKSHWKTKTRNVRYIPLNEKAVEILKRCQRYDGHDFVFTTRKGTKISDEYPRKVLQKVLERLGLEGHIHKLRHTFASHLVMKGEPLYNVSKLLGHTSIDMTQQYAHLAQESLKKTVDKL